MIKLKELRKQKGLKQKEVAKDLNLSTQVYCNYETEKRKPTPETLCALAKYFDVSIDYLLGNSEYYYPDAVRSYVTPTAPALTEKEKKLLDYFRSLSPYLQEMAMGAMQTWAGKPEANPAAKKKQV